MAKPTKKKMSQLATAADPFAAIEWEDRLTPERLPALVDELHASLGRLEKGYHRALYSRLAAVAALAQHYRTHPSDWGRFCEHKAWATATANHPRPTDAGNALGFVMRFSFGFNRKGSQAASKYKRAIEPLLKTCRPADLPEAIEQAHGIVALLARTTDLKDEENYDDTEDDDPESLFDGPEKRLDADKPPAKSHNPNRPDRQPSSGGPSSRPPSESDARSDEPPYLNVDLDLRSENVGDFRKLETGTQLRLWVEVTEITPKKISLRLSKFRTETD